MVGVWQQDKVYAMKDIGWGSIIQVNYFVNYMSQ